MINGGIRNNIIPDSVVMIGTVRTLDRGHRTEIHRRITLTAQRAAESIGATAAVDIALGYPVTWNDPALTEKMAPTLKRVSPSLMRSKSTRRSSVVLRSFVS